MVPILADWKWAPPSTPSDVRWRPTGQRKPAGHHHKEQRVTFFSPLFIQLCFILCLSVRQFFYSNVSLNLEAWSLFNIFISLFLISFQRLLVNQIGNQCDYYSLFVHFICSLLLVVETFPLREMLFHHILTVTLFPVLSSNFIRLRSSLSIWLRMGINWENMVEFIPVWSRLAEKWRIKYTRMISAYKLQDYNSRFIIR